MEMPPETCQVCGKPWTRTHECELRATYQGWERHWRGVVKNRAGEVVAVCLPLCRNRDQSSRANGRAAVAFADDELRKMQCGWFSLPR